MSKLQFVIEFLTKGKKDLEGADVTIKDIDKNSVKAGDSTGNMKKGADKASRGFKGIGKAIIASGIGALVFVLVALAKAFQSNEAGQNKFKKIMNAIGVVVGNLTDILAKFGTKVIDAFSNPKQAMQDFVKLIKDNIETRINSTIEMFGLLGKTVAKVFKGDFKGALETAKEAGSKYVDSMTGVEDSIKKATKAVTGFIDESKKEIAISNELSDIQANIDTKARELIVERARIEAEVAKLRLDSNNRDKFSAQERMDMLTQAQELNNQIFQKEQTLAQDRLKIIQERNKLSGSTKEDLDEEAQLQADLISLAKTRDAANMRMLTRQQALSAEVTKDIQKDLDDETKATEDAANKKLADQKKFYVALKFEVAGYTEWKTQQNNAEIDAMELTEDQKIALKKQKLDELEQAEDKHREDKKEKESNLVLFLQDLSRSSLDGMISEIDELFNYKQDRSNEEIELEMELNEINHQARLDEIAEEMAANRASGKDNKKLMLEKQKLENAYAKQKKKLNNEIAENEKSLGAKMVDVMKSGMKSAIMMLAKEAMGYAFTSVLKIVPFPLNLVAAPIAAATAYAGVSAFASGLNEGGLLGDEHDKKILEQYIPPGEDMLIAVKKGEYVLNTEAVRKYFPVIDQMNDLSYSDGGLVENAINYGLEVSSGSGSSILQILMEIRDINRSGFEKKSDVTVNNEFKIELDGEDIAKTVEEITAIEEGRSA